MLIRTLKKLKKRVSNYVNIGTIPLWQSVLIEITSDCNRDCWFCMRYNDRSGIRKDKTGKNIFKKMPTWKVVDIFEQLRNIGYTGRVGFHFNSEPLLDDRVCGFALLAKKLYNLSPYIFTNADLIRKGTQEFTDLVAESFDQLHIGQYDFSNEEERQQDRLELTLKLRKAKRIRFTGGPRSPYINMDEEKFKAKYECSNEEFTRKACDKPCLEPSLRLIIRYDGEVIQCCRIDTASIGNVYENSIEEIWYSESHINFVKDLSKPGNRKKYDVCKICPIGGEFPRHIKKKIEKEMKAKKDYYYCTPKWITRTKNT